jgi:hypothetical protein
VHETNHAFKNIGTLSGIFGRAKSEFGGSSTRPNYDNYMGLTASLTLYSEAVMVVGRYLR